MNTMKKAIFVTMLLSVVMLGASCAANQTAVKTNTATTTNTAATNTTVTNSAATNTATATTPSVKEFTVTASQFSYSPSTITVNAGDTVKLHLTSSDTTHGFSLPDFNVSKTLTPGSTTDVEFVAGTAGTYTYSCSVVCGAGHAGMKGTLTVQ